MVRVDPNTGNIVWTFQPVPINLDDDVDWTAGAAIMSTSCGELIASVQKDGWTYAVNAGSGTPGPPSVRWQFPPTGYPFDPNGPRDHGDDGYRQPGAAWGDVLIIKAGGENLVQDTVKANYSYLHALNACATTENTRVRWIAGIPYTSGTEDSLGAPTVTGGIVFVGTDQGYLVVLADPSVWPPIGYTCSNPDYPVDIGDGGGDHCEPHCRQVPHRLNCLQAGYAIVPIPQLLAIVRMPDGGSITGMRNEPALANGRVFVGTLNGHVYMMEP
jgi:outer membrane protein assembly factor BamB